MVMYNARTAVDVVRGRPIESNRAWRITGLSDLRVVNSQMLSYQVSSSVGLLGIIAFPRVA